MIRLSNIRVAIDDERDIKDIIASKLKIADSSIVSYRIHKKSIDARNKMLFSYVYEFDIVIKNEKDFLKKTRLKNINIITDEEYIFPEFGNNPLNTRPIVIGMGPSGLFAAYFLAMKGFKPLVFERGECVEKRVKSIATFWQEGKLNKSSNVQYGEGGAGTFSDGKLNTLVKDKANRMSKIFEIFVENGAPEEIMYDNKPHIGTDILRKVVVSMRNKIIAMGGEIHFDSYMQKINVENNKIKSVIVNDQEYFTDALILATGHSARDTYESLITSGVNVESKPFAIGIRIMHPQKLIDENQYPVLYNNLPPASYKLTYQSSSNRGVYSFCMCPGGYVVNASSEDGLLVINGMSDYERDSKFANSAIIVTVGPDDFGSLPLSGMQFLEKLERNAYNLTNGKIPVQTFADYQKGTISNNLPSNLAIKGQYVPADINKIFPLFINDNLKEGINYFDSKIKGFAGDESIIMAPETRTSSPVKIPRNANFESNITGIYPCGEGSGYAGGITTSAIDGVKVFEQIMQKYYINY